jgi:hypothetical protein
MIPRVSGLRAHAPALISLLLGLTACDGGEPLRELNRGFPSLIRVESDTSSFDAAAPSVTLPVEVRVTDPYGDVVAGAEVVWRARGGSGAHAHPDTSATDGEGRAATVWAVGSAPGAYALDVISTAAGTTLTVRARVE